MMLAAVEPEPRKMVSRGSIISAAALAMSAFCGAWTPAVSSQCCSAGVCLRMTAPP